MEYDVRDLVQCGTGIIDVWRLASIRCDQDIDRLIINLFTQWPVTFFESLIIFEGRVIVFYLFVFTFKPLETMELFNFLLLLDLWHNK